MSCDFIDEHPGVKDGTCQSSCSSKWLLKCNENISHFNYMVLNSRSFLRLCLLPTVKGYQLLELKGIKVEDLRFKILLHTHFSVVVCLISWYVVIILKEIPWKFPGNYYKRKILYWYWRNVWRAHVFNFHGKKNNNKF